LSAVADRLGFYGPPGSAWAAWGAWEPFVAYTRKLNFFLPAGLIPAVAIMATLLEVALGLALLIGYRLRQTALASGALLSLFALAMAVSSDPTAPFDYSVFSAAGAAFLLAVTAIESSSDAALRT
jgi:putative oxidoreductase